MEQELSTRVLHIQCGTEEIHRIVIRKKREQKFEFTEKTVADYLELAVVIRIFKKRLLYLKLLAS